MIGRRLLPAAALAGCGAPGSAQVPPRAAGEMALRDTPALASHKVGAGFDNPDLILRWNRPAGPSTDLVLHFHGFAADARGLDLRLAMGGSGLDLAPVPEAGASGPLLTRPTLALLPRGRPRGATGGAFDWPALSAPGGLSAVLRAGLTAQGLGLTPARITLTAHSGGGGGVLAALDQAARDNLRIDRVILYDALYREPAALLRWARATPGASLTIVFGPGTNERNARAVAAAFPAATLIPGAVSHGDQPRFYGWRLLARS